MVGMTGYSYKESYVDDIYISTEIRSVNHRFLDISVHLQQFISPLEINIKELISTHFNRGKIDINVFIKMKNYVSNVNPNLSLAKKYCESINLIKKDLKLKGKVTINDIIKFDDVISIENSHDSNKFWEIVRKSIQDNIKEVIDMKKREGDSTQKNIYEILAEIEKNVNDISKLIPTLESSLLQNLRNKIYELVGDKIDNDRIAQEAGILVSKSCINEEINRLNHHINHFYKIMKDDAECGKKLDFLCQEMQREINTLGNKALMTDISVLVINIKNYIEKIREQLRNIE